MTRLSERINQLSGRLDKAATKDKTIGVVGTILFSPALMAMIMALAGCASPARIDQLTADLLRVDQPMFGFDMTVSATVRYLIVEHATGNRQHATGKEIFPRNIPTSFTAKVSNAFVGAERLKLANEGAVRNNFAALIDEPTRMQLQVSLK